MIDIVNYEDLKKSTELETPTEIKETTSTDEMEEYVELSKEEYDSLLASIKYEKDRADKATEALNTMSASYDKLTKDIDSLRKKLAEV